MSRILRYGEKGIEVKKLQELLNVTLALTPKLIVDGDYGANTLAAVNRYQAKHNLGIDGVVGPKTWKSLLQKKEGKAPEPIISSVVVDSINSWMKVAKQELGQAEIAGKEHNPKIIKYHASTTLKAKSDEVAWCSSFVNWVLTTAKLTGTNSAAAASWLNWGEKTTAKNGAIVVIRNAKAANSSLTTSGNHVGFLVKETATHYVLLGGNQSNQVKVSNFPKASWTLRGYRWPEEKA
jgi:uncharacterized protein (TIGR02594 family)